MTAIRVVEKEFVQKSEPENHLISDEEKKALIWPAVSIALGEPVFESISR